MIIRLICVGKTVDNYLLKGEEVYMKRLKHYIQFEKYEIPELKQAKRLSKDEIKVQEGKLILNAVSSGETVILLDENGKTFNSIKYAKYLEKLMNRGGKSVAFVVGGAYGFSEEVYQRADDKISLSEMTFSHQMVRLFFMEQLYRAFTILRGEPYHHA